MLNNNDDDDDLDGFAIPIVIAAWFFVMGTWKSFELLIGAIVYLVRNL